MTPFRRLLIAAVPLTVLAATLLWAWHVHESTPRYHDDFLHQRADEWRPYGGAWQLSGNSVIDRSDERGAKLMTGSKNWRDYELSADVKLLGHDGDIGLIIRGSEEERGVDAYNGYYAGLRSSDSSLIMGRADHGWAEGLPVLIPGGVLSGRWYHLRIVAVGCNIGAEVTDSSSSHRSYVSVRDERCAASGGIGLRTMGAIGAWKNLAVKPATLADWDAIQQHSGPVQSLVYPLREADYNRMRNTFLTDEAIGKTRSSLATGGNSPAGLPQQPLALHDVSPKTTASGVQTIRGVVTLTDPLYIQGQTGGTHIEVKSGLFNLGDEVEFFGKPTENTDTLLFHATSFRLLWSRTPVPSSSITSTQAATGAFEGSLVDVSGTLVAKHMQANGSITLDMNDAAQSFRATMPGGLSAQAFRSWEPGSELRVRGICTVSLPSASTPASEPDTTFTVLLRSVDDVEILQGPSWWNGWRIVQLVLAAVALTVLLARIYVRLQRTKDRAVLAERERLAHEMHDTLAQSFAGVGFQLQGVRNSFESGKADIDSLMKKVEVACNLVTATHREASASIAALHPDADGGLELLAALERCVRSMVEEDVFPVTLESRGTMRPMSMAVRDLLFQVGREAMANVFRHSSATAASLLLTYEPDTVNLEVRDNGQGFDTAHKTPGFGIRTMRRRVENVGATLELVSQPGAGSTITVRSPYGTNHTLWQRFTLRLLSRNSGRTTRPS